MLSQARPPVTRSGAFPRTRPGLLLDAAEDSPQDHPERVRVEAESGVFEATDQESEVLPLGDRLQALGALWALPQKVPHQIPGLLPGELRLEETFDRLQ